MSSQMWGRACATGNLEIWWRTACTSVLLACQTTSIGLQLTLCYNPEASEAQKPYTAVSAVLFPSETILWSIAGGNSLSCITCKCGSGGHWAGILGQCSCRAPQQDVNPLSFLWKFIAVHLGSHLEQLDLNMQICTCHAFLLFGCSAACCLHSPHGFLNRLELHFCLMLFAQWPFKRSFWVKFNLFMIVERDERAERH